MFTEFSVRHNVLSHSYLSNETEANQHAKNISQMKPQVKLRMYLNGIHVVLVEFSILNLHFQTKPT